MADKVNEKAPVNPKDYRGLIYSEKVKPDQMKL
jgi:hypothetical protein